MLWWIISSGMVRWSRPFLWIHIKNNPLNIIWTLFRLGRVPRWPPSPLSPRSPHLCPGPRMSEPKGWSTCSVIRLLEELFFLSFPHLLNAWTSNLRNNSQTKCSLLILCWITNFNPGLRLWSHSHGVILVHGNQDNWEFILPMAQKWLPLGLSLTTHKFS